MRIFCSDVDYDSAEDVEEQHTDVVAVEPCEGGWMLFTDATSWEIWMGAQ